MEDMRIDQQRAKQLIENLRNVTERIQAANTRGRNIRLVAVSKLKPANDILALHTAHPPHHHFGENYFQELAEKAALLPRSTRWHFIGALQTNKCKPLAEQVPNLWCVASVDSAKKADGLEKGRAALVERLRSAAKDESSDRKNDGDDSPEESKLRVMVQVNTSGETSKSGVEPSVTAELCRHIQSNCPHLHLQGLMTIGAIARSVATTAETENEDFVCLCETRDRTATELGLDPSQLKLSMGMSSDFEGAIAMGSDEIRVGSTIFGERPPRKEAKVSEGT